MQWLGMLLAIMMAQASLSAAPDSILRKAGVDAGSGIAWVMIGIDSKPEAGARTSRLIAQCTKNAAGKMKFELLAYVPGEANDETLPEYYAPWKRTNQSMFPPELKKLTVTMDFLGYMKVKPVKRE